MRISDWSSDVCSSDLVAGRQRCDPRPRRPFGQAGRDERVEGVDMGGALARVVEPGFARDVGAADLVQKGAPLAFGIGQHRDPAVGGAKGAAIGRQDARIADGTTEPKYELTSLMRDSYAVC